MSPQFLRPARLVAQIAKIYPKAWRQIDELRAKRKELGGWPDWCFLPLAGAYAIVSGGRTLTPGDPIEHIGILGALGTWRATQGVYRFDETILDTLWDTPITGDIPVDVIYHLPEWCVYIVTPGKTWQSLVLHGFFAHLEYDVKSRQTELRLLLDASGQDSDLPIVLPVHIGRGGVAEGLEAMLHEASSHSPIPIRTPGDVAGSIKNVVSPLISLVLYLCSQAAEIGPAKGTRGLPRNPKPIRTKEGMRLVPPERLATWEVGYRLGSALRRSLEHQKSTTVLGSQHNSPRPHVRRAHWHAFWVGPRDRPEDRSVVLKWLPPTPVNVRDVVDLTTTVRPV